MIANIIDESAHAQKAALDQSPRIKVREYDSIAKIAVIIDEPAHAQRAALEKSPRIKVRGYDSIALHWFNATVWLVMAVTGFGLISGAYVRLVPPAWPETMQTLFGGHDRLTTVHALIGVTWVAVFFVYTLVALPRVIRFLKAVLVLTPWGALKDAWSMAASLGKLFGLKLPHGDAGRFNGAQRLLGTLIIFGSLGIAASGLYLYFAPKLLHFSENAIYGLIFRWSLAGHITLVLLILFGLVAHIYYAVVEERQSLESMTTGEMPVGFIRAHFPKWYRELKAKGELRD
jgi:formate dehydrogenase subunit gamma